MRRHGLVFAALLLLLSCGKDPAGGERRPVKNYDSTTGIDQPMQESRIICRNIDLYKNTAMQGFHLDSDGKTVWYVQNYDQQLSWVKGWRDASPEVSKQNKEYMLLKYFGHGTVTALEEVGSDRYLWVGAYGTPDESTRHWYFNEKVIGRVKFRPGSQVKTNECDEYYYIGEFTNMHPSIDQENDLLTINYQDDSQTNRNRRCFVVYRLSEAKAAPVRTFPITCGDAFVTGVAKSRNIIPTTVDCHDLTGLEPVARFSFPKTGYGAGDDPKFYDWQGFDFHKDRLYYYEGQSNQSLTGGLYGGESFVYVTVFDKTGMLIERRTRFALSGDKEAMTALQLSVFGYMEAEGIKVYGNRLYIGCCTRGRISTDLAFYNNIFEFKASSR